VRKGIIRFTKNTPELFKDLIKKLLSQNTEKRLGFEKDAESVREHPWFADVDWEQVIERRL
jgi:protein kinase A